jgi:hypothetical protein
MLKYKPVGRICLYSPLADTRLRGNDGMQTVLNNPVIQNEVKNLRSIVLTQSCKDASYLGITVGCGDCHT